MKRAPSEETLCRSRYHAPHSKYGLSEKVLWIIAHFLFAVNFLAHFSHTLDTHSSTNVVLGVGCHLFVAREVDGVIEERPYTPFVAPGGNNRQLELVVKKYEQGVSCSVPIF